MRRIWFAAPVALGLTLVVAQTALAAGGPVGPVQGSYIGVPGSPYRYAAFEASGSTVVKRREAGDGPAVSVLRVSGHYGIPGVDYSGATTGLSADGRTLMLARIPQHFPPRMTRLLVLDTAPVAVRARLMLPGWSTVDALSPDGRWLYLIHYARSDISRYEVLAYNLPSRRLLAKPVVDPRDRGEAMTGIPINRVMSANGRWAYTLYLRGSGIPFVHALDTTGHRAVCIDLPSLSDVDAGSAHLSLSRGGRTLDVDTGVVTRAVIDTRTFSVSASGPHSAPARVRPTSRSPAARGQDEVPWELIVLSIAALGVLVAVGIAASGRHADHGRGPREATVTGDQPQNRDRAPADEEVPIA